MIDLRGNIKISTEACLTRTPTSFCKSWRQQPSTRPWKGGFLIMLIPIFDSYVEHSELYFIC